MFVSWEEGEIEISKERREVDAIRTKSKRRTGNKPAILQPRNPKPEIQDSTGARNKVAKDNDRKKVRVQSNNPTHLVENTKPCMWIDSASLSQKVAPKDLKGLLAHLEPGSQEVFGLWSEAFELCGDRGLGLGT